MTTLQTAKAQTLPELVKTMLDCEPELIAVNADSRSSYEQWNVTRGSRLPQISVDSTIGGRDRDRATDGLLVNSTSEALFSRDIGITLRQLVFDGGTSKNLSNSDLHAYKMQRYLQMAMIEDRVVDLTEIYLEIFRTREQIALANTNVEDHRSMLSKLKIREEGGDVKTNAELIQGRLSRALNRLDLQNIKLKEAKARFKRLLCCEPNYNALTLPKIDADANCTSCNKNWNYLAAQSALKSSVNRAKAQGGLRVPQVYLDLGASRGQDSIGVAGADNELRALLTMSWDLSTGGSNRASQRLYKHQVEKAAELVVAAKKNCAYDLELLKTELDSAHKAQNSFSNYTTKLKSVMADYDDQFKIGMQSLIDMLDIRNELYEAKSEEIDSRYDIIASKARVLGKQGRLVSSLVGSYVTDKYRICEKNSDCWVSKDTLSDCEIENYRPGKEDGCNDAEVYCKPGKVVKAVAKVEAPQTTKREITIQTKPLAEAKKIKNKGNSPLLQGLGKLFKNSSE